MKLLHLHPFHRPHFDHPLILLLIAIFLATVLLMASAAM